MATTVETEFGQRLSESRIKQLTGGDRITARFLHEEFFEFTPTFKIILATNHAPILRGADVGIRRRLHLVPFGASIDPGKRDPYLKEKRLGELPGILNWAVRGCLEWRRYRLSVPAWIQNATNGYVAEFDILGRYLEERIVRHAGTQVSSSALYDDFRTWCGINGHDPDSSITFSARMQQKSHVKKRINAGWVWLGIKLKEDPAASV